MIRHADIIGEWVINRSIKDIINKKEFKLSGNGIFTNKNNIFHYKEFHSENFDFFVTF